MTIREYAEQRGRAVVNRIQGTLPINSTRLADIGIETLIADEIELAIQFHKTRLCNLILKDDGIDSDRPA